MAKNKGGLGRGLASLIPDKKNEDKIAAQVKNFWSGNQAAVSSTQQEGNNNIETITFIPLNKISANPYQPREHFSHSNLEELINSIKEHGILQPLVVAAKGDEFELIAGERRFRAAQFLELDKVPAIIRDVTKQEQLELSLIENIQRQDLNAIEKARAYQRLIDEFNLTQAEVAQRVGKSRAKVANTLRFLNLPAEIQQWLAEGKLTEGHAKILLEIDSPKKQLTIAKRILRQQLTVRDAKNVVDSSKDIKIKGHIRQLSQRKYKAWENNLESVLGTKVNIDDKKGKGRIIIEYYSEEELRDLVDRLSRLDDDL